MTSQDRYIDEAEVSELCDEIDAQFAEKGIKRPLHQVLAELQSIGAFANEYVDDLRRLHEHGVRRNQSVSAYVVEAYSRTGRIRRAASFWNQGAKIIEEQEAESSERIAKDT
jgi:hypothetical protein